MTNTSNCTMTTNVLVADKVFGQTAICGEVWLVI